MLDHALITASLAAQRAASDSASGRPDAGPGRAALTRGERLREPGAGLLELLGEGGDADEVDTDAHDVGQVVGVSS